MQAVAEYKDDLHEQIKTLEAEIADLERDLSAAEMKLNGFENQIRTQLDAEITQVNILTLLYKKLQRAKKDKRLEQKKKGKNYKEPVAGLKPQEQVHKAADLLTQLSQGQELKRLYREAMLKVHPDKFAHDKEQMARATDLTTQLIEIYKSGDLEDLVAFHEHIVTGNAMSHVPYQPEQVANPASLLQFLQKKKAELDYALEILKSSYTYQVLETYENPLSFIDELRVQFQQRILQLQKRTRKA